MRPLLVTGGTILTQDPDKPVAQALLIDGDTVAAVGAGEEVVSADAERLDLEGRVVCPGFIDAHNHFVFGILAELGTDCRKRSIADILAVITAAVEQTPPGQWVRGWGYDELKLADGRHPELAELDAVAPDHPLVISHSSCHMCVANSLALRAAGITTSSGDPAGGIVERRRRSGRPTGLLHESASEQVDVIARNAILAADPDACVRAAHTVANRYASLGITSICDPCVPANVEPLYTRLLEDDAFPLRLLGLGMGSAGLFTPPLDRIGAPADGEGFTISGVKFFADGGEQCAVCMSKRTVARTALRAVGNAIRHRTLLAARMLTAPVARLGRDGKVHSGIRFYDDADLGALLARTTGQGMTAAIHAMGNEAIDQVLGAVEHVRSSSGGDDNDAVFRMEHAMMPAEASLERMAPLGVAAVVQPRFVHEFGFPLLLTGINREFRVLAFRDLLDQGVLLAGSSDAPVCDPAVLPAIESAVTRRTEQGEVLDRDQALTVEEALGLYTTGAARVLGLAGTIGSLRRGSAADFVVLDADPRAVDPQRIGAIRVERTYRAGRLVHTA